jgi:type VI secretion system protein ImpL
MRWALVVFVTLVLVGVWVLALLMPDLRWFAEVLTCVVLAAAVLVLVIPLTRERMKRAQADRVAREGKGPDRGSDLAELRARLRKAFAELERMTRGSTGARKLPWYLALGAPESGRTTMLERLGLSLVPVLEPAGPGRPAPDRAGAACDLWCSQDAVVVDVKASSGGEDAARDVWLLVLDEVRRLRPRRPIEGVLATVSVPQISGPNANAGRVAALLRARIDDVLDRLDLVVPVYVVVTMADRLPGFTEFWTGFSKPDDSTWGASFASDDDNVFHEPARAVGKELEVLAQSLHPRLIERLPAEVEPSRRVRVLRFPLEFRALATPAAQLVGDLCRPGPAPERFVLRGVYFVSAAASKDVPGGPYFVTDFFRSVVLPDRNLATPAARALRKRGSRELRASFAALGLSALVLGPAIASYLKNVDLATAVRAAGAALGAADPSSKPGTKSDPIEAALDALGRCDDAASGLAVPGWWAPRAARELRDPLDDAYLARLGTWMSHALRQEMDRRLDAITSGHGLSDVPSTADDETPLHDAYATLKLYATLVDPKGHAGQPWATDRLASVWRSMLPDADAVSADRLALHARNYLAALENNPGLAWPAGRPLAAARERLRRLDVRGIPYRRILLAAKEAPGVRASAIFSPASLEFLASRGDIQVPGPFTAAGWEKIRDVLHSPAPLPVTASVERWVVDDPSLPADDASLRTQVLQTYFDEYTRRWMSFLDELKVKTPTDVATATAELSAFKEGDGFYKTLFDAFKRNAIHDEESHSPLDLLDAGGLLSHIPWFKSESDAGTKSAAPSSVENSFRPLLLFAGVAGPEGGAPASTAGAPIEKYLSILDKLKAVLEAPPAPIPSGPGGQSPFSEASTGVAALLDGIEEPTRGRLWRLLMPPVMGGVSAVKAEGASSLSDDWKAGVWTAWDQKLKSHFPFTARADAADFGQFSAFFKPDGLLWAFVKAHLADRVEENGEGRYVSKQGADPLPPDLLGCLSTAQEITDAFFSAGEDPGLKLSVQADWTASNVGAAKFWVGSKDTALPKSQWAGPVRWLGEDVRVEWQEDGRPTQELGRHSFSLFDLFEHLGGLKPSGTGRSIYTSDCPPLTVKLRPEGKVDALRSDFFTRLRCPAEIRGAGP